MKTLYFVAIIIPEPWQSAITDLKISISDLFKSKHALKLPAHITLIPPFRTGSGQESIAAALDKAIAGKKSFEVRANGFGFFKNRSNRVLYVAVEDNPLLFDLYESLNHAILPANESEKQEAQKFKAHITVANRDLKRECFDQAKSWLAEQSIAFMFQVNEIVLFGQVNDRWMQLRRFKL